MATKSLGTTCMFKGQLVSFVPRPCPAFHHLKLGRAWVSQSLMSYTHLYGILQSDSSSQRERERERERATLHNVTRKVSQNNRPFFSKRVWHNAIWCCHRQLSCAQGMTVGRALGTTEDVLLKTHSAYKYHQTAVCTIRTYVNKPHKCTLACQLIATTDI